MPGLVPPDSEITESEQIDVNWPMQKRVYHRQNLKSAIQSFDRLLWGLQPSIWVTPSDNSPIRRGGCKCTSTCANAPNLHELILHGSRITSELLETPCCNLSIIMDCSKGPNRGFNVMYKFQALCKARIRPKIRISPDNDSAITPNGSKGR